MYLFFNPAPYKMPESVEFWLSILWGFTVFSINIFFIQLLVIIANTSEEQLAYQLSHDKLTGLPNRYYLSEQFKKIKTEENNYWLALSDIDDFKKIQAFPFEYENIKFSVTMTFGISCFSSNDKIDNVLRDADNKLYQGKQSGKNKVVN